MLKYTAYSVQFQEVPNEISLSFYISRCPHSCKNCHSQYLQKDIGNDLSQENFYEIYCDYIGMVSCICLMGGDADIENRIELEKFIKNKYPDIKVALYTGNNTVSDTEKEYLDYLKVGPYIEEKGPLNNKNTNQKMFFKNNNNWVDITYKFQEIRKI